ncbi:MAG TPA: 3-dehydroquinate synthase [Candidatus Binataceae bacterium]|nr:3-dehydroquinate synthase [Candidatus Binataceae bacterium]
MRTFSVALGARSYPVHVGTGILDSIGTLALEAGLSGGRVAIVTDSNVAPLYLSRVATALDTAKFDPITIEIAAGESSKSLAMLESIYDRLVAANFERGAAVFALGGGVVGDLAGFAAATYLRGVPLVQVPTTLVAQVDSALGGKTGVNHRLAKNLIGAFYEARMVVADVDTLGTLGEREFREGLAEVIKYGAIMDAPLLDDLERGRDAIAARDRRELERLVELSLRHKASVVERDEREAGLRRILNFGHTVGHALEAAAGYNRYLHGEAVAIGMVAAARLSETYAGLSSDESERLRTLIAQAGLPVELPAGWAGEEFARALNLDKKRAGDKIEFVLLDRLGHALTRRIVCEEIITELSGG